MTDVVFHYATDRAWGAVTMTDTIKITSFAGHSVPEEGLRVQPPQGGELTVWPDGGYAFTAPAGFPHDQEGVTTYYGYVMEDIDGVTSCGTFELNPHETETGVMHDFRAWSLPDLLDGQGGLDAFLSFENEQAGHASMPAGPSAAGADFVMADAGSVLDDDIARLLAEHHFK